MLDDCKKYHVEDGILTIKAKIEVRFRAHLIERKFKCIRKNIWCIEATAETERWLIGRGFVKSKTPLFKSSKNTISPVGFQFPLPIRELTEDEKRLMEDVFGSSIEFDTD